MNLERFPSHIGVHKASAVFYGADKLERCLLRAIHHRTTLSILSP